MKIRRRNFLQSIASTSGAALVGSTVGWPKVIRDNPAASDDALPAPEDSGIEHLVVVTMENRSFDHFFGWFPNADTRQANTYPTSNGTTRSTHPLAPDFQGCGHNNPDHSYSGERIDYNDGAMDGWLRNTNNDKFCVGFYEGANIPFLAAAGLNYTTLDHYFSSLMGPTFPNRMFMLTGQTDRLDDSLDFTSLPTIFDRLAAAGVSAKYYFNNLPFLALWGLKYLSISHFYSDFLSDAAAGTLPEVSFVDPRFTILDDDTASDDEPHTDIRRGDYFLSKTFEAVASGPAWGSTVLVMTFDECGGFFDHVAPPRATAPLDSLDQDLVEGKALLGIRVPTVVASPWTRGDAQNPVVNNAVLDHASILKLIEWRWGLEALTARDASGDIANLASVLNFAAYDAGVPELPRPSEPSVRPCFLVDLFAKEARPASQSPWAKLASSNVLNGWPVTPLAK